MTDCTALNQHFAKRKLFNKWNLLYTFKKKVNPIEGNQMIKLKEDFIPAGQSDSVNLMSDDQSYSKGTQVVKKVQINSFFIGLG